MGRVKKQSTTKKQKKNEKKKRWRASSATVERLGRPQPLGQTPTQEGGSLVVRAMGSRVVIPGLIRSNGRLEAQLKRQNKMKQLLGLALITSWVLWFCVLAWVLLYK
ncbi:hypothetical protein RHGRI_036696 [Rhododendron griersonianum]|uniref:50S ribosomal protein L32, chloroplastic n=1 Tax=Rhododendron griersonianum TaxID=479676 RepID=A0AAV6HP28_9ERIC|nr:hypothetical protein RHGRI_036696 [Rhododendron griersonianum]